MAYHTFSHYFFLVPFCFSWSPAHPGQLGRSRIAAFIHSESISVYILKVSRQINISYLNQLGLASFII